MKKKKAKKVFSLADYQPILALKPTQFAVGHMEVEFKTLKFSRMKPKKLKRYIEEHPIPVVISPWAEICIVDHHHLALALWHARIKKAKIEILEDFSNKKLSYSKFWYLMKKKNYAYLYDQFGDGPRSPYYLPNDVRGLADDPYRSLAWMIRKEGKFEYNNNNYVEFMWADIFRQKRLLDRNGREGFDEAIKKGLRLLKKKEYEVDERILKKKNRISRYVPRHEGLGHLTTVPELILPH